MIRSALVKLTAAAALAGIAGYVGPVRAEIGTVQHVAIWAYGTPPQAARGDLFMADGVDADEVVETVARGALHIEFLDGTELRLGASSTVTLDSFVYDPDTSAGEFAIDLGTGVFRIITGSLVKESYAITTPVAVIGVRGTDFYVEVVEDGPVNITIVQGSLTLTPDGGEPIGMATGQSVSISEDGAVTTGPGAPRDPGLGAADGNLGNTDHGEDQRESSPSD